MLLAVAKFAAPIAVAAGLLIHSFGSAFAAEPIGLSNVSGGIGSCTQAVSNGVCATLFDGSSILYPGKTPDQAAVTIGYHGTSTTGAFGVYLSKFESKSPRSASYCNADDPAAKLNLTIAQGGTVVYQGNLSDFAALHHDPTTILHLRGGSNGSGSLDHWKSGDSSDFTISVGLDISADNAYMGCVSTANIAWLAA